MKFTPCKIKDVILIEPVVYGDSRGFFMESWNLAKFTQAGITDQFVQQNHSRSKRGTLRGLHYQINKPQGKLVRVTRGEVFDVAVDVRKGSSTFGKWHGQLLSEENNLMMWVPEGFAHGFLVLSESADFQYSCSDLYSASDERSILWNDPEIGIDWPIPEGLELLLSEKDKCAKLLAEAEVFP